MFPWTTRVCPWIDSKSASVFYFIFSQGELTEVTWFVWWSCWYDDLYHWGKFKGSWVSKRSVERSQKHKNRPDYQDHYHSQHLENESIDFLTIGIEYWSLLCLPIDDDGSNIHWITEWMLTCTSTNKIEDSRVDVSFYYGRNRWCGTRYRKQCNQDRSRGKVGIADVWLNENVKGITNHGTSLLVEGK